MKSLYLPILLCVGILTSCQHQQGESITNPQDYNAYLSVDKADTTSKYFRLWNSKITPDSTQLISFGFVAGEYNRYFRETGKIEYLKKAEQALEKAVEIAAIGKASYDRALARNYISQHRFREALELANAARDFGSGVKQSQYLLFDIHLELGNYSLAEKYLDSIRNFSDFGYLIRLAKWNDHLGDQEKAITIMEKATHKAEEAKNSGLMLWTYTNLADYYGHAGRVAESYRYYLKSLALDPANAHAKKGIAWIVFSYEKNPSEALRILDSVTQAYEAPDYYLLKAEIASYLGDESRKSVNLDQYFRKLRNPGYGDMYNAYSANYYLEEGGPYDRAISLARTEVKNRPTPKSYDLLAYSLFKNGQQEAARDLVKERLLGKTSEPSALLHMAEILKATGERDKVGPLKTRLLGSLYELGPAREDRVRNL